MSTVEQKKVLRKHMLAQRAELDPRQKKAWDQAICDMLWDMLSEREWATIHCYLPMRTEVDIVPLIRQMLAAGLTVVTPKTLPDRKLQHLVLRSLDELEWGVFGTSHPAMARTFSGNYDLIIVPGLAFDKANYRLGYGGGYYDAFLLQHPDAYKAGIGYPFQLVNKVPVEEHDVALNQVLSATDMSD